MLMRFVKKTFSGIWIMKRLLQMGASQETLIDTYDKQVRTILEYCVPVWHPRLTRSQSQQLERVQNVSMRVILGDKYSSSSNARHRLKFDTLYQRRSNICLKFGMKALEHPNHSKWFQPNDTNNPSRIQKPRLREPYCRTERYRHSTIPFLTRMINTNKKHT